MKNKSYLLIGGIAIVIAFITFHEPEKLTPEEDRLIEEIETASKAAEVPRQIRPSRTVPGNYIAARFAVANDDLKTASEFYTNAINVAKDDLAKEFLIERTLPALTGTGDIQTAYQMSTAIDLKQSTATAQLAVLIQLVEAFKTNDEKEITRLMPFIREDGFGRLLKPLIQTWAQVGNKNSDAAIATLHKLEKDYPSLLPLVQMHLAFVNEYSGKDDEALKYYKRAIDNNFSVRSTYVAGNFYERLGKTQEAIALYQSLAMKMPSAPLPQIILDRLQRGDLRENSFITDPRIGVAAALYDVATVLHQEGSSRLSIIYAQLAHYLAPDDNFIALLLGDIMANTRMFEQAQHHFYTIPKKSDLYVLAQLRLAQLYEQLDDPQKAVDILQGFENNPLVARQVAMELGETYRRKEDFKRAIPYYTRVMDMTSNPISADWVVLYARGIAYERTGQWEKAEADLLRALELSPQQPEVLNYLAYSWADHGKNLDKALDMLQKALAGAPDDPYIADSVGWALHKKGRNSDAVPFLELSVQQLPADPLINDHLGDVYWAVGRELEARFQWDRALKNTKDTDQELRDKIQEKLEHGLNTGSVVKDASAMSRSVKTKRLE